MLMIPTPPRRSQLTQPDTQICSTMLTIQFLLTNNACKSAPAKLFCNDVLNVTARNLRIPGLSIVHSDEF